MPRRKGNVDGRRMGLRGRQARIIKFLSQKRAKDLSTVQLLRLLAARQQEISYLRLQKQKLEKELSAVNARLSDLEGAQAAIDAAPGIVRRRGRKVGSMKATAAGQGGRRKGVNRAAILKLLSRKGKATIPEMQAAVAKAGGNPKYVQKTIQRMMSYQEVERVPNQRGVYQLKK